MRLMSFRDQSVSSYGIARKTGVVDLRHRYPASATLRDFLAADLVGDAAQHQEAPVDRTWEELRFEPVITNPDKIVCVGLNYRDHIAETKRTITDKPVLFARFTGSQSGHEEPLVRPKVSVQFDYEGELAVVIGKPGRHIPENAALNHVAGYSCYNDGSIRDWQRHTTQFLPGKTFASTGAFGPWLVTADEIPDPTTLTLETRLNGQVVQRATTDLLIHSIPRLINYISTILPLLSGDVIVTGTPGGVGDRRDPQLWMKPGDTVAVEITAIGTLTNTIENEH
jgi:2-keto-4-pentenoate hydratase/2-oxohepta-3-ene-1,7-dioic acid hydratase in catechol pathway